MGYQRSQVDGGLNMPNHIEFDRRRLLYATAAGAAASLIPVSSSGAAAGRDKSASLVKAGANTSFAALKEIDAGLLNVSYAEAGPADGPAASCFMDGPTISTASSMWLRRLRRAGTG